MPLGQTATPTPGVGVGEVVDLWPYAVRAAWFFGGFLIVVVLGWLVFVPLAARAVRHRNPNNSTLNEAIVRYLRLLFVTVGLLIGIATAGYGRILGDSALVVAAATLALGVAGQTVIGSIVSGLVLVVDPEFNVGDYIVWEDGEGSVQSITLRVTRVLTRDGELVTVPNTVLTEQTITRPFGRGRYRVVDRIAIAYDSDIDAAKAAIEAALTGVEDVAQAPSPRIHVEELGDDEIPLLVHYWIEKPRHKDIPGIRSAVAHAARDRLDEAGVEISPPSDHELKGQIGVEHVDGPPSSEDSTSRRD